MRRVKATIRPDQRERRDLFVDVSQRGQLRYYVQLRNKLPKIRIKAEFGTRKVIKAEMKASTPSQAGNLLSALRGMIRWDDRRGSPR
jgi:hypothetical protein